MYATLHGLFTFSFLNRKMRCERRAVTLAQASVYLQYAMYCYYCNKSYSVGDKQRHILKLTSWDYHVTTKKKCA